MSLRHFWKPLNQEETHPLAWNLLEHSDKNENCDWPLTLPATLPLACLALSPLTCCWETGFFFVSFFFLDLAAFLAPLLLFCQTFILFFAPSPCWKQFKKTDGQRLKPLPPRYEQRFKTEVKWSPIWILLKIHTASSVFASSVGAGLSCSFSKTSWNGAQVWN